MTCFQIGIGIQLTERDIARVHSAGDDDLFATERGFRCFKICQRSANPLCINRVTPRHESSPHLSQSGCMKGPVVALNRDEMRIWTGCVSRIIDVTERQKRPSRGTGHLSVINGERREISFTAPIRQTAMKVRRSPPAFRQHHRQRFLPVSPSRRPTGVPDRMEPADDGVHRRFSCAKRQGSSP